MMSRGNECCARIQRSCVQGASTLNRSWMAASRRAKARGGLRWTTRITRRSTGFYSELLQGERGADCSYVYCNELLFSADEDVRHVMNRLHLDRREVQRVLAGRKRLWSPGEWDYRVIPLEGDEQDLSTSVSLSEADPSERAKSISSASAGRSPPLKPVENRIPSALVSSVTSRRLGAASARPGSASGPGPSTPTPTPKKPPIPVAVPSGKSSSPNSSHPRGKHIPLRLSDAHTVDPHPHPSPQPPPASPLSVYMLAHRYRLDVLESLAKERILTGMTVDNCMPML